MSNNNDNNIIIISSSITSTIIGGPGSAKVTGEIFEKSFLLKYVQELKMHCVLGNLLLTIWGIMALLRMNSSSP